MSQIPELKRLVTEEFPDQKDWIEKLTGPLNNFMESVVTALSRNLTIFENFDAEVYQVRIDGTYPVELPWSRRRAPTAAWIGFARETEREHVVFTDALFLDWEFLSTGFFRINGVAGLTASDANPYQVTIIAIAG